MTASALIWVSGDPFASKSLLLSSSNALRSSMIFGHTLITGRIEQIHLKLLTDVRSREGFTLKAFMGSSGSRKQLNNTNLETVSEAVDECDIFNDLKYRFLSSKKNKYMENVEQFQKLAKAQTPKPGEAFMIRNVANLVLPFESGPSETNAALEFAVNSLKVEHIFVIGHSCCGGIRSLMSMLDDANASSFIKSWVVVGKKARIKTEAVASDGCFDQQCRHCEKESINHSLLNLLTYPWIEEKVVNRELLVHGGYYDFIDCSFEKWTLDYRETRMVGNGRIAAGNKTLWS